MDENLLERRFDALHDRRTGRSLIVPLDHGYSEGPMPGLTDMARTFGALANTRINGIIVHQGAARAMQDLLNPLAPWPFLIHVSGKTPLRPLSEDSLRKVLVANAADALELGASGVSVHVNLGNRHEDAMITDLVTTIREAHGLSLPVLVMMYVRSWDSKKQEVVERTDAKSIAAGARAMAEAGADIVKVSYPGDLGDLESSAEVVGGCFVPVMMAGGTVQSDETTLNQLRVWTQAGGAGGCLGRIVFANANPSRFVAAAREVLRTTPSKFSYPQFGCSARRIYMGPDADLSDPNQLSDFSMASANGRWSPGSPTEPSLVERILRLAPPTAGAQS